MHSYRPPSLSSVWDKKADEAENGTGYSATDGRPADTVIFIVASSYFGVVRGEYQRRWFWSALWIRDGVREGRISSEGGDSY